MQPHQYALAAGISWMVTLIILPFLIAKARQHAYTLGFETGRACTDQTLILQLKDAQKAQDDLRTELERAKQSCTSQLDARQASITALKARTGELEARIMSYIGLPVTKADYENLLSASTSMRLAQCTFTALKSQTEADRAVAQAIVIEDLAKRIHAHLRATPASAATAEAEA